MAQKTPIEWTNESWNPMRGCTKISPGCKFCYAETFAHRFTGVPGNAYELGFTPRLVPERLVDPLTRESPIRIFVNSMSDLFHKDFPDNYLDDIVRVMEFCCQHTFQILTKRSERMRDYLLRRPYAAQLRNVLWGVSVENKQHGLPRIDHLRDSGATFAFLSIEPLLEDLGELNLTGISQVIVGGESGAGCRPMLEEWVTAILGQTRNQRVAFFFKQWGGAGKNKGGRLLNGKEYNEFPAMPTLPAPTRSERRALKNELLEKYGLLKETSSKSQLDVAAL